MTTNPKLRRGRKLFAAITAMVAAVALSACTSAGPAPSSSTPEKVVHLTLWSWSGATPEPVKLWNKTHPKIQINLTKITAGGGGGYAKMLTAIKANNAPDLGQIEYNVLPSFIHTGGLLDLVPYGAGKLKSDFTSVMWNQVAFDGGVFAIPRDSGPMGLYYRSDLFEKYGLSVPSTWDEFMAEAKKVREIDPNVYLTAFQEDAAWLTALAQQAGSKWFSTKKDSWTVNLDDEATVKVADYWQQMIDQGLVKPENLSSPEFGKDLSDGTLLTYPAAIWGQLNFNQLAPQLAGSWRAAPLPSWGTDDAGSQFGGSSFAVFKNSKHPKEAAQFATWLGTDPGALGLLTKFGDYPSSIPGQDIPEANTGVPYFGGQNIYPIFKKALNKSDASSATWGPTMTTVFNDMRDAFTKIGTPGGATLSESMKAIQKKTVSDMKSKGFKVKSD